MLNQIVIMGRFTRNPELRYTEKNHLPVAYFTLACERDFTDEWGQKQTDFIDCVAWRGTAEFVDKYFTQGKMAVVVGRLQIRQWEDDKGNKRKTTEIVVSSIYFGDSKKETDNQTADPKMPDDIPSIDTFIPIPDDIDDELPFH